MKTLSQHQIEAFLATVGPVRSAAWRLADGRLAISLTFPSFADAMAFMAAVARDAEQLDHHPEWFNVYNRVDIWLTTHEASGLTQRDLDLARAISRRAQ